MTSQLRLSPTTDTVKDVVRKLSKGNHGAVRTCMEVLARGEAIDPQDAMGSIGPLLRLDSLGIYGPRIWMLRTDVCAGEITNVLAVLRAWQLGIVSAEQLNHAIDNGGRGIDMGECYKAVRTQLVEFDRCEQAP